MILVLFSNLCDKLGLYLWKLIFQTEFVWRYTTFKCRQRWPTGCDLDGYNLCKNLFILYTFGKSNGWNCYDFASTLLIWNIGYNFPVTFQTVFSISDLLPKSPFSIDLWMLYTRSRDDFMVVNLVITRQVK